MNIEQLRGILLFAVSIGSILGGCAFYFLIIGVFEMGAAIIGLCVFVAVAAVVWTRPEGESTGRRPQA